MFFLRSHLILRQDAAPFTPSWVLVSEWDFYVVQPNVHTFEFINRIKRRLSVCWPYDSKHATKRDDAEEWHDVNNVWERFRCNLL